MEKKLKISGKFAIENEIGVERFNELCRESVHEYVADWVAFSERMGFWLDYDNAYWTLTPDYIQSVWWALSEMWKQGLVYKGFRVAPVLPALRHAAVEPRARAGLPGQRARPQRVTCASGSRTTPRRRSSPGRPPPGRCPATSRWRSTRTSTTSRSRTATTS